MANNELVGFTRTKRVFTYKEAREHNTYLNTLPTISKVCWRDVKTGGTVVFTGV